MWRFCIFFMKIMLYSFGIIRNGDVEFGVVEVWGRCYWFVDEVGERVDSIFCLEMDYDCVVWNKFDFIVFWVLIWVDDG